MQRNWSEALAVDRLIDRQPLALLVSQTEKRPLITPVPVLQSREGTAMHLTGHLARTNPHVAALQANGRALAIVLGPHHYLSPSWLDDRTQAPSWHYALTYMEIDIDFDESPDAARAALTRLTEKMEHGRDRAWDVAEMGPRFERLMDGIVAFRATVRETYSRFKIGQTDREDVFKQSLEALLLEGAIELVEIMRAGNKIRSSGL